MGKRDPRVDAYIAKAADFAKPILEFIRDAAHTAIPDVRETMKWSSPFFEHNGTLAMMAAFKEHVRFGFWRRMKGIEKITSVKDLPSKKELVAMFREADANPKSAPARKKAPKAELDTPKDLGAALKKNKTAANAFDAFPPSHRREYILWIVEAKTDETRKRRLDQAIEWIAEGKPRNWKYVKR